jgi:glycine dehydrogenase subunit 2
VSGQAILRRYQAPVWSEPVIMEMGAPGRRGLVFPAAESAVRTVVGDARELIPSSMLRTRPPVLPELSEHEVERHYLHLSQQNLGMIGISLFGTCTMKYNPRINQMLATRAEIAELHPDQHEDTLQGVLEIVDDLNLILRELSGMDQFVFQAGGGAHAAYTHACVTRAYHADRGELRQRDEVITTIQTHPCNAATAAASGFRVITLPIEENGYPSLDALKAALSERTAALMINNPDDMGIYNPHIKEWVKAVHEVGALAFYDHANFNGVMGKIRARELGFDACMFMLHKTFGALKAGGPAVGAYGCAEELIPYLPRPFATRRDGHYGFDRDTSKSIGHIREFWGNIPQIVRAYGWCRAMGAEGINEASDLSVLANNYMEPRLLAIRGISRTNPEVTKPRMEMTRYSLRQLTEETGVTAVDVENRMTDFGVDAFWTSHEPWLVPEPFTPEAGESWSKEELDYWIAVIKQISGEAYSDPELVRSAPHNQPVHRMDTRWAEEPGRWATTWRAYRSKALEAAGHSAAEANGPQTA